MKTLHRFFVTPEVGASLRAAPIGGGVTVNDPKILHQWRNVLRLQKGNAIALLDDSDKEYRCTINEIEKGKAMITLVEIVTMHTEPRTKITLYQAIPKQLEKLEFVVQKGTELGAFCVVPLLTERTLPLTITPQKMARLEMIAQEATEQSERTHMPQILEPQTLQSAVEDIVKTKPEELLLCTDARENHNQLKEYEVMLRAATGISIFIGPEGGLSTQEIDFLKQAGAQCVQLGPRVLRTETVGLAILAALFCGGLIE